ncbi:hypothetical protein FACS1894167_15210 [Synergistales bacterium]|nr:hypothetical protein FACS1894167_15210 [Synergistales bacterium]
MGKLKILFGGRPSPAAKKTEAALSIALARLSSAFSLRRRLSSSVDSAVIPTLAPLCISDRRTHESTVSKHLTPNKAAAHLAVACLVLYSGSELLNKSTA